MNIKEYRKIKEDSKTSQEALAKLDGSVIVISPNNEEITIGLGALEEHLEKGYRTKFDKNKKKTKS